MTPDKATLEAQLGKLTNDWTELQTGLARLQQEIQQLNERTAQKSAEMERQKGAIAYNQILSNQVKDQLAKIEASNSKIGDTP